MNTFKAIAVAAITTIVCLGAVFFVARLVGNQSADNALGAVLGITRYPNSGIAARYLKVSTTAGTASAGTDGTFSIGGGTEIDLYKCATATWNPGSIATSTLAAATSTDIALSGAVLGDLCIGSLNSATTTAAQVTCAVTATGTTTIQLVNLSETAVDYATGTARTCIVSH